MLNDRTAPSWIVSDQEWLSHVQSSQEIAEDFAEAFPGHGELAIDGHVLTATAQPRRPALEAFRDSLAAMAAGFADIEAAERHYVERMGVWLAQERLRGRSLFFAWLGGLLSSRLRARHQQMLALRQAPQVSAEAEAEAFAQARGAADRRIQKAARLASAWTVQAAVALLLMGHRRPSPALSQAVRARVAAVTRRDMIRHRLVAHGGGASQIFTLAVRPPPAALARPRLLWPALLGCQGLPRQSADPMGLAVAIRADGLEWDGTSPDAVLELQEWEVRLPLGEPALAQLDGLLGRFGRRPAPRGREETLAFRYNVPEGVESLQVSRLLLNRREDVHALTVRFRYLTRRQEKASPPARPAPLAAAA
ncbi:hypothetical protein [Roseomonas sp. USHLN139]|uniref:hypothetical protein n=1 Tax=Roseomonas sp. USHLN139 TaxID=3081298 RepID=UPI003B02AB9D